jgi:hypothetical protein
MVGSGVLEGIGVKVAVGIGVGVIVGSAPSAFTRTGVLKLSPTTKPKVNNKNGRKSPEISV